LCRAAGFVPRIAQTAGEASTIIGLVAAGSGITLLPSSFDRIRMDGVCYRPISDREATTMLLLAQRAGEHAPLIDAFVALVTDAAKPKVRSGA
jgi:DNA-binding transcriptional LysR family regulator